MSFLEKLLEGVSVEWKPLGEVTFWDKRFQGVNPLLQPTVLNFKHVSAAKLKSLKKSNGNVKLLSTGNFDGYTTKDLAENNINFGEVITIPTGGTANLKYYNGEFVDSGNLLGSSRDINLYNLKYIYIYLLNINDIIQSYFRGSGVKHPSMSDILAIPIPIPCPDNPKKSLEIQQEIVRVLDELTSLNNQLTTELETERQSRKKQFEFFREQMFKEINLIKLGDNSAGEFIRGSGLQKKDFTETGVGCIHYGQLYTHYKTFAFETKTFVSEEFAKKARKASTGDLIIATTSENDDDVCKAVAWLGNEDIAVSSDACFYRHKFNPKYVAYYFQTEQFQKQKRKYITGTKVRRVNANDLAKILIPNPPLQEQERIVKLLDQFDATHTAIEEEITKEIKLRTQQYEYYREKLLSFPQN